MINIPILPLLILVPLIGVIFVLLSVEDDEYSFQSKKSALWTSIINFLLSLYLPFNFDKGVPHFQFVNSFSWLNNENLKFSLGVDGISLPFILLLTSKLSQEKYTKKTYMQNKLVFLHPKYQ